MKLLSISLLAGAAASAFAAPALAQCRDPWVSQAVREVQGRAANGAGELGECNIKLYGNGSWSSYPDLLGKVRARYPRVSAATGTAGNGASILTPAQRAAIAGGKLIGNDGGSLVGTDGGTFRAR